jgi:hypothetical protein
MAHGSYKNLAKNKDKQKSGNRPAYGTESYIAEDIQAAQTGMQWIKKVIQHKKIQLAGR